MKVWTKKQWIRFGILNAALLCLAILCAVLSGALGGRLEAQKAARRWQGEGETEFTQVSCYLPVDGQLSLNEIYRFRYAILDKLKEAALDGEEEQTLFVDAWSSTGKLNVATEHGKGEAAAIAVGGSFFHFHPLRLLNGSYLTEADLMKDRVLLDEDLAWLLYGGTELEGMELKLNGVPVVVGGVIRREEDSFSRRAYTAGQGLYLSWDAWKTLNENAGISCYELCLAEPVKGFTVNFVREKFPIGQGEILENTGRFGFFRLLGLVGQFGRRSMQTLGVVYPYWENAARSAEDWGALLALFAVLLSLCPLVSAVLLLVRGFKRGKEKFSEDLWPRWRDALEEAIRKQERKAWEKRHPGQV